MWTGEAPSKSDMGKMVSKALGVPVFALNPALVMNHDDTGLFACEAHKKGPGGGDVYRLCSADEKGDKRSVFKRDNPAFSVGLAVKFTTTISAAGTAAPMVAVVTGLTAHELSRESCPSGMLVIKVPGFCVGGGVDIFARQTGYVVFLREKDEGDECSRGETYFDWYNTHILEPFIDAT
jgi:hypothetical protein